MKYLTKWRLYSIKNFTFFIFACRIEKTDLNSSTINKVSLIPLNLISFNQKLNYHRGLKTCER
jgi:hypothetical protein